MSWTALIVYFIVNTNNNMSGTFLGKTSDDILNGKHIRITKEAWELLKVEKRKVNKSIARIASNLIIKQFNNK